MMNRLLALITKVEQWTRGRVARFEQRDGVLQRNSNSASAIPRMGRAFHVVLGLHTR